MTTRAATVPSPPDPATLVAEYGRLVSSLCWRMTRDREVAREAAQEVWLAVLEGLPRFRGEASVSTWIYAIARRVIGGYAAAQRTYSVRFLSAYFEGEGEPAPPQTPDLDLVKQMGGPSPCRLFCLDPIEGMIVGLAPDAAVDVEETLYDGGACRVRVQARVREEAPAGV